MRITNIILFKIFLIFILPCISSAQDNFLFLNYSDFIKLTQVEQNKYIHEIQNLIIQFEEQKDTAPQISLFFKSNFLIKQFFNDAFAVNAESTKIRSNDTREENAKISIRLQFLSRYIQAAKDHPSKTLDETVKEEVDQINDRLMRLSQKEMSAEQKSNLNINLKNFQLIVPNSKKILATSSQINKTQPKNKSVLAAPIETKKITPQSARCLYSGFVIFGSHCTPFQVLPSAYELSELKKVDFKCKSKSEILCNPLVFGFQKDLSPYCVNRSQTASKNCQEISNNSENRDRVQAAWKNSKNKKIFDDYQNSLKELCNSENRSSDVKATCKVVVAQFNEVVKKEFPSFLAARKIDEATGSKSIKSFIKN